MSSPRIAFLLPALVLVFTACAPLDRRPLFRTRAYSSAHEAIDDAVRRAPRSHGAYRAGWGRAEISMPEGVPLAGFGDREGAASTGTRDPVFVRAFAIDAGPSTEKSAIVIFTADLLLTTPDVTAAVARELRDRVHADALFFTASHTHSGPGGYASGLLFELVFGAFDPRAFDAVVRAHTEAAKIALATLSPARIGSAELRVPHLIMNRVERGGPTDDHLFVLRFDKEEGPSAAIWSFGCHAVTLPSSNLLISADYPGELAKIFEKSAELDLLGYAAGGVGSSNPRYERTDTKWLTKPLGEALEKALGFARMRGRGTGSLASAGAIIPLPAPRYRVTRNVMLLPQVIRPFVDLSRAPLGAVAIGDTVLIHEPGEVSGELTRTAREVARERGITLAIFPFNGAYTGYIVPHRVYELPDERGEELFHYETRMMAFFGPWSADMWMNLALELAAGVRCAGERATQTVSEARAASMRGAISRPTETVDSYENSGSSYCAGSKM